jgi:hypothetical protein
MAAFYQGAGPIAIRHRADAIQPVLLAIDDALEVRPPIAPFRHPIARPRRTALRRAPAALQ